MGSPIGERTTIRATGNGNGIYRPTAQVLPQGSAEQLLVVTGKLRSATITGQVIIDHRNLATTGGFVGYFLNNAFFGGFGNGAAMIQHNTRQAVAGDVGKLTRYYASCSVANALVQTYCNGYASSPGSAIGAYSAGTPNAQTFLDSAFGGFPGGLSTFEVIDCAMVEATFVAADVRELDRAILAAGRVPGDYCQWSFLYRIDDLKVHPTVLDAGGQSAGLGLALVGTSIVGAFDQTLPLSWGPAA